MGGVLLDVNVLLALAWPNHQYHGAARSWFAKEALKGWASCALTELAFVRLSSNPAYTPEAVTPQAAAALLARLAEYGVREYWTDLGPPASEVFSQALGHQQVVDAYLVWEAERHHGRLATFDRRLTVHARHPSTVLVLDPGIDPAAVADRE
jgi:hypothetical protein